MRTETRTFTETLTYRVFDVGEKVHCYDLKDVRIVSEFHHPLHAGDRPIVFLEGYKHGVDPRHIVVAEPAKEEGA